MKQHVTRWGVMLTIVLSAAVHGPIFATQVETANDAGTGWTVYTIEQGAMAVQVVPQAGANVDSIRFKGTEVLKGPKALKELPGFMYGVPLLYPMPNRVRDGIFSFEGQTFRFTPNNEGNFLHGLVHSAAWEEVNEEVNADNVGGSATVRLRCRFEPEKEPFRLFPLRHNLQLEIKVSSDAIRWTYTVDNRLGDKPIPFGFALHPWFLYQGARKNTYVTIPATHLMEAEKLLPTGKLLDLATAPDFDARQPRSLEGFLRDDVYYGMQPAQPAVIDFRDRRLKITLATSEEFTHLVLYTPKDQPWFCVENQTCSTDAHNLFARGLKTESHLQIVPPGKTAMGWVEYRFASY